MANHRTTTSVPVNDEYAALVGKAFYVFAYYEWTIIWIIELLEPGFVGDYSRGKEPLPSGSVLKRFNKTIGKSSTDFSKISKQEVVACRVGFKKQIERRNALLHAHPITDADGEQILAFQANPSRPIPDMKWTASEVVTLTKEFDSAAIEAAAVLDKLRN